MATSTFHTKLRSTNMKEVHQITLSEFQSTAVCPPTIVKEVPDATTPHHLFLASIGSCINLVFEIALQKGHIEIFGLQSVIEGEYETDESTRRSRFGRILIKTTVSVTNDIPDEKIQRLFDIAVSNCPIGNSLENSSVVLSTELKIEHRK